MRSLPWLVALLCLVLAGCSPPAELSRPPAPPDASARLLLPPGRVEAVSIPDATDAAVVVTDAGRLLAARFATSDAAIRGYGALAERLEGRAGVTSRNRVAAGRMQYLRYAGTGFAGLLWVSDDWVFSAEAASPERLAALIAGSQVGGIADDGQLAWILVATAVGVVVLLVVLVVFVRRILRSRIVAPAAGVAPVPRAELVARLMALGDPSRPWQVRGGPEADLVVEWKYADAAWWGILAKQGVRELYRLRLYLDEAQHRVGALDETSEVAWSAGALATPRFAFERQAFRGVQLFKSKREVAYGFDTPTGAGFGKQLDVRFDLESLKGPVIDVVTRSGWSYVPVLRPQR